MLALAGYPLGIECRVLDTAADAPGAQVAPQCSASRRRARARRAREPSRRCHARDRERRGRAPRGVARANGRIPPPRAVAAAQDRLAEKTLFRSLGIPTDAVRRRRRRARSRGRGARARLASRAQDATHGLRRARSARSSTSEPRCGCVARARRSAVDRRAMGSVRARGFADRESKARTASERSIRSRRTCIATESCARTVAPYVDASLQAHAERWLGALLGALDYRGVLTVEFFQTEQGLLANEMAPRVHNSGHWTIEGAETSQFENHLRAVLGWPLGSTRARGHAAMLNL